MNDDEIKCLCKKLSKQSQKITTLECKNYGLEKENEQLKRRIDLLENTQVQQHYDWKCETPLMGTFKRPLDMYTLEKVFWEIENKYQKLGKQCINNLAQMERVKEIQKIVWNMLDEDSKEWIRKGKNGYYD